MYGMVVIIIDSQQYDNVSNAVFGTFQRNASCPCVVFMHLLYYRNRDSCNKVSIKNQCVPSSYFIACKFGYQAQYHSCRCHAEELYYGCDTDSDFAWSLTKALEQCQLPVCGSDVMFWQLWSLPCRYRYIARIPIIREIHIELPHEVPTHNHIIRQHR